MRHLDLFSGIGGFAYAAQQVWGNEHEIVAFCEIDKFCQKVLKKHWPEVEIVEDVRSERIKQFRDIDLLAAGVPCQPASVAGSQRGTDDDRWLWPETLAIIGSVRPRYAILENVPGLFGLEQGLAFNGILSGLAEIGYDCWWETIPACAVGAPHRRDRIWIVAWSTDNGQCGEVRKIRQGKITKSCGGNQDVAYSVNDGRNKEKRSILPEAQEAQERHGTQHSSAGESIGAVGLLGCVGFTQDKTMANACDAAAGADEFTADAQIRTKRAGLCEGEQRGKRRGRLGDNNGKIITNTERAGLEGQESEGQLRQYNGLPAQCGRWNENWLEVATRLCVLDDGISRGLVRPKGWRANALKAGGNAIVPQAVMVIMQAIKEMGDV